MEKNKQRTRFRNEQSFNIPVLSKKYKYNETVTGINLYS